MHIIHQPRYLLLPCLVCLGFQFTINISSSVHFTFLFSSPPLLLPLICNACLRHSTNPDSCSAQGNVGLTASYASKGPSFSSLFWSYILTTAQQTRGGQGQWNTLSSQLCRCFLFGLKSIQRIDSIYKCDISCLDLYLGLCQIDANHGASGCALTLVNL